MSQVTTHILDTSMGRPAEGVPVIIEHSKGEEWIELSQGVTNADGRVGDLLAKNTIAEAGTYRIIFETEVYFKQRHGHVFYPRVTVEFEIADDSHYHIPLLLSPYGYSTYRGS